MEWGGGRGYLGQGSTREVAKSKVEEVLNDGYIKIIDIY